MQSDITEPVPIGMPALNASRDTRAVTGASGQVDVLVSARNLTIARGVSWMAAYEHRMPTLRRRGVRGTVRGDALPGALVTEPAPDPPARSPHRCARRFSSAPCLRPTTATRCRVRRPPDATGQTRQVIEGCALAPDPPAASGRQLAGPPRTGRGRRGISCLRARPCADARASLVIIVVTLLADVAAPPARAGPAGPDRVRDGLVGAARVPAAHPPEPDVRHPRHARDCDHDRVQRAVVRACPPAAGDWHDPRQAIDDAYRTTGIAVLTSALTAIAGFAVLTVSNITMLRDFGLLALVDLSSRWRG